MASTPTDSASGSEAGAATATVPVALPPALSHEELAGVPGVLGRIGRERAADYSADHASSLAANDAGRGKELPPAAELERPGFSAALLESPAPTGTDDSTWSAIPCSYPTERRAPST